MLPVLEAEDVVMELGGGVGHLSINIAKLIGSEGVYTFEANPELEPLMRENFRLNAVQPHAEFCMLGHEVGKKNFTVSKDFWASSTSETATGKKIQVPTHSLNDRIREINPTFFIVDIEGSEGELFRQIDFHNIKKILIEIHPWLIGKSEAEQLISSIVSSGYDILKRIGNCYLFKKNLKDEF